jgi:multidrug efflux pump subunit AcrB
VNLLMYAIIFAGIVSAFTLRREFFPEVDPEQVLVTLPYPGASPEEIESTLAIKVEDKLHKLNEIDEMNTTISEGGGGITVKFREGVNFDKAMDEVEREINSLLDLPEESETIQVTEFEARIPVMRVVIYGEMDETVMKRAIRAIRDDLTSLPEMGEVVVEGMRDYEIRVDVRQEALLKQGISLPEVADRVNAWMIDLPGGTVRTTSGDVKVRTLGVAERARAIRDIPLRATADGRLVNVGDIADVRETFVDEGVVTRFNGQPGAGLTVYKVGKQDIVQIAEMVRSYVSGRNGEELHMSAITQAVDVHRKRAYELGRHSTRPMPPAAKIAATSDFARFVEGRLELLVRNALYGAVLVFATLLVFLNWRAALWVGVGLVTAVFGTVVFMDWTGVTLNLLTMFGLIIVLGLLVDDAIVVAENIQTLHDEGMPALDAAIKGTDQVFWPVVATVLTTVVAFLPLTFIKGNIGDLLGALPTVVAMALMMSLLESLLILPSHMGHTLAKRDKSHPGKTVTFIRKCEHWRDRMITHRLVPWYGRTLDKLLRVRYLTSVVAATALIVSVGMVAGGHVPFTFLESSDAETIIVDLRMPIGTPLGGTNNIVQRIEDAAAKQSEVKSVSSVIGQRANIDTGATEAFAPHVAQIFVELFFVEQRDRESSQVIASIRDELRGKLTEIDRISFSEISGGPGGSDISLEVRGQTPERIGAAVRDLKRLLGEYDGVTDIADNNDVGQIELQWTVKPEGAALGFTVADVARQVRGALYGLEAHVFPDQQENIKVRVRIDEATRRDLDRMENIWLISPTGRPVPLREVADVVSSTSYATIKRIDRERAVTVTADTQPWVNPEKVTEDMVASTGGALSKLDELRSRHPAVTIEFGGRQEEMAEAFASLPYGFLAAMLMIYVILAWLFNNYLQPLVVLSVVPFSLVGVVWGHFLLGYQLTFLSLIGFVALSGIVVNDSLILVEFYNTERARGVSVHDALVNSGRARLRAIMLTTITTVLGLTPLILEQSFQAKFLIPMAIAIAAGLISATSLVLVALPCFIMILDDIRGGWYFLWHGERRQVIKPEAVIHDI